MGCALPPFVKNTTMKTLRLVATPTRNRRLNELIGLVVLVGAGLLLLALASYTPADASWNTVADGVGAGARNWTGLLGAYVADATKTGDWPQIIVGIAIMSLYVVLLNRLVWKPLYYLAETRYRLG